MSYSTLTNYFNNENAKLIGQGFNGVAFEINNNIIKLTTDDKEYHNAKKIIKLQKNKQATYIANVYDCKIDNNIFIIKMEKLKTLAEKEIACFNELWSLNVQNINVSLFFKNYKLIRHIPVFKNFNHDVIEKMLMPIQQLKKYKINGYFFDNDIHGNNVGWRNNQLAILDLGAISI